MRRFLAIVLVLCLPLSAFAADFLLGPSAIFDFPVPVAAETLDQLARAKIGVDDFTFGAEARLRILKLLEFSANAMYRPAGSYVDAALGGVLNMPASIDFYFDGGVYFNMGLLGAGIGLGPNFIMQVGPDADTDPFKAGFNMKLHGDINLGKMSVSLLYLVYMPELNQAAFAALADNVVGSLGASVLFRL